MLAISFFEWWYSRGWSIYFQGFLARLRNMADSFSIGLLFKTLFQPFRQISATDGRKTTAGEKIVDALVSRLVGFIVRIFIIIAGAISLILLAIGGVVLGLLWPAIPLMPLVGVAISSIWGIWW